MASTYRERGTAPQRGTKPKMLMEITTGHGCLQQQRERKEDPGLFPVLLFTKGSSNHTPSSASQGSWGKASMTCVTGGHELVQAVKTKC